MASITIHSSFTIVPSRPTPNGVLQLSASDQMMGMAHYPSIYIYKASDVSSLAFDSLRDSLSEVLVPFYPLAGRLRWIGGNRVELDCCAAGVHFVEASSNAKLDDYGDFTPSEELLELAPKVDYNNCPIEELPLLYVQVTRFSCGGLCINTCISHTACDGSSGMTLISTWASIARGEKTIDTILKPYHERDFLKPRMQIDSPRFHHQEFEMPPVLIGQSDAEEELSKKEWTNVLLKLSKDQVEKLKERANKGNSETTTRSMETIDELLRPRPYTRYESIVGHIWVCASKARSTGESCQPTMVSVAVDLRQRLRPPLPKGFFGNATLATVTPTCEFGDLIVKPLSYAAEKIRQATSKCTDDYLESALDFLENHEDIGFMRPEFRSIGCCETRLANPNLDVGSWIWMPLYDADFGWGRPYYAGPMNMVNEGETYILPSATNDGSLAIVIQLQKNHMNDFKKHFYQDL